MPGSRKSLKNGTMFNPRASNEWSKDESKFGQKMLEKMGWKQGQGIGLNNQGIAENIKVRLKLDSKGLGYQIKDDQWLEVRSEFSQLLSQLSQGVEDEAETFIKEKKSLEAVSQSSKSRVHYHKFTHGKDIARYKKEDLIGILGKKENEDKSAVPENKEFIQSGNMEEYFKSKRKKSKNETLDLSSVHNNPEVDDQSNDLNMKPIKKQDTSDSKDNNSDSNSRKRKKSAKNLHNDYEIVELYESKFIYENSKNENADKTKSDTSEDVDFTHRKKKRNSDCPPENNNSEVTDLSNDFNKGLLQEDGTVDSKDNSHSNSRKRKKSAKNLHNEYKLEELCENGLIDKCSMNRNTDEALSGKFDDTGSIRRKKKRNLDHPENNNFKITDQNKDSNMESIQEDDTVKSKDNSNLNSQKRKKTEKNMKKECDIEELSENCRESIVDRPKDQNIILRNEKRDKNSSFKFTADFNSRFENVGKSIEKENDNCVVDSAVVLDEKIQPYSQVELKPNIASEKKLDENDVIPLQFEISRKGKKKKAGKADDVLLPLSTDENKNMGEDEEQNENNENEKRRKKKHKSHNAEEHSTPNTDVNSTEINSLLQVVDDSTHKLKKIKSKSKKMTDEKDDSSIQENVGRKTKASNTLDSNSADFMKSVIDYNSCNNVEDYISNFEKNREELLNKYREKYKMKYLMSSSDQIQVYGDEFDGKKLDCKKPKSDDMSVMKIKDRKNMSKAERIVAKARLLRGIKENAITHDFVGSNLSNMLGYGNKIC